MYDPCRCVTTYLIRLPSFESSMSESPESLGAPAFTRLVDLAAERLGGQALQANDEFFAPKENVLKPGRGVYVPDKYTDRGKWMDGWETRRRRTPGHDWVIIRLGLAGIVRGVDIDTNHFLGNHPPYASLDACWLAEGASPEQAAWAEILPKSPLEPGCQNLFAVTDGRCRTHLRLNIYPDGGVARLRVFGEVVPDWSRLDPDALIDLAAVEHGGQALACSDRFFSDMRNLILPGPSRNMGDGWETRRRRGPGHDWVIIRLGAAGHIRRLEIDTTHFKGNYPDQCSVEGGLFPEGTRDFPEESDAAWTVLLPKTPLQAHHQHIFEDVLPEAGPYTHVRLTIFPDGGIARLRVFGTRVTD